MNDITDHEPTRAELYERARAVELPGRSSMDKAELAAALAKHHDAASGNAGSDRARPGKRRTDGTSNGDPVLPPRLLEGRDRRLHVRKTLRDAVPAGTDGPSSDSAEAFDTLAESPYSFFRGTASLFYRDMADEDADLPVIEAVGEVHPDSFGLLPTVDGKALFGITAGGGGDRAPFARDLKRGTTAFLVAARDKSGRSPKKARRIAEHFVRGYVDALQEIADGDDEPAPGLPGGEVPKPVRRLIKRARRDEKARSDNERGGSRVAIDLEALNGSERKRYAAACGRALAFAHVAADERGRTAGEPSSTILEAIGARDLFIDDVLEFADEALQRVRDDHALYCRDHALGAFTHRDAT